MPERKVKNPMPAGRQEKSKVKSSRPIKKTVSKTVAKKAVKKTEVKKETVESTVKGSLKITVMGTDGKSAGTMTLSKDVFGAKVNPSLMSQAVRVYLANQRQGNASTKSRGEISLTTAKWYRQKGTGRARHGAKSAPIFVKGGVAHGPKPRDFSLSLPTKMKKAALVSALSDQMKNNNIIVVSGIEKLGPKTKNMANTLKNLDGLKKTLIVMPEFLASV